MRKNKNKLSLGTYCGKHKVAIFFYVLISLIASLTLAATTILMAEAIENIVEKNYYIAINYVICVLLIDLFRWSCWYITSFMYHKVSGQIISQMYYDLSKQSFRLTSKVYSDNESGLFMKRMIDAPKAIVETFAEFVQITTDLISSTIVILYVISINIFVGLILVGIIIICVVLDRIRVKVYEKNNKKTFETEQKITSLTTEIIESEKDIKSLGLEQTLSEVAKDNYEKNRSAVYKESTTETHFWRARNLTHDIGCALMLVISILLLDKSLMTVAAFMVVYSHKGNIYELISCITEISSMVSSIKLNSQRVFSLFDEELFEVEKFGDVHLDVIDGEIEFKNVAFTYRDYELTKDKKLKKEIKELRTQTEVFKDLSFKVPKNKMAAFVGKSGSGKSTILNLMSKIYNADNGEILIDNTNIQDFDKETLRNSFTLVNQFPYIFDMTIRENLQIVKPEATEKELNEVLRQASLEEFVSGLEMGLDTKVGEKGIKLSGGQKQRLAIARALLRSAPIILFDESTSSLDNIAQAEVKKNISALKGRKTTIVVAHRLSTIKDADIIFFLHEGVIVDQGTFEELFERNKQFKEMFLAENI